MSSHLDQAVLPNAISASEGVITGGTPVVAQGFAALQNLKVRTVISVDGARPPVELARTHQMRYVHLPIGYEGIDSDRCRQLARAVAELPRPIYIHCHHGQHRAPAAAAVALIGAGKLNAAQGRELLIAAGTGTEYPGLWKAVAAARPLDDEYLTSDRTKLPEVVEPQAMTAMMADLQTTLERMESTTSGRGDTAHDRLAADAVLLREQYKELLRLPEVRVQSTHFQKLMKQSQKQSMLLTKLLRSENGAELHGNGTVPDTLVAIRRGCQKCHAGYRDNRPTIRR